MTTDWKIRLNAALAAEVELRFLNSATGRPRYGSRKAYIEKLIRDDLEREKNRATLAR